MLSEKRHPHQNYKFMCTNNNNDEREKKLEKKSELIQCPLKVIICEHFKEGSIFCSHSEFLAVSLLLYAPSCALFKQLGLTKSLLIKRLFFILSYCVCALHKANGHSEHFPRLSIEYTLHKSAGLCALLERPDICAKKKRPHTARP